MLADRIMNRLKIWTSPSYKHKAMVMKWDLDGGDKTLRFNYDLDEESVVLDLGGFEGQWASELYDRYRCRIFIFEPVSTFAENIRKRFQGNDKIQIFSYGLGGSSRSERIHVCAEGSSVFRDSEVSEDIEIVDVKDWIEKNSLTHIDLMKINIEGGEYELFDRLIESQLLNSIDNIQVQFHDIAKDSRLHMKRIQKALMQTHEPTYRYEFVWENWKRRSAGI
jgi:FkbM family methyltransferase